jgi:hypothetical protein
MSHLEPPPASGPVLSRSGTHSSSVVHRSHLSAKKTGVDPKPEGSPRSTTTYWASGHPAAPTNTSTMRTGAQQALLSARAVLAPRATSNPARLAQMRLWLMVLGRCNPRATRAFRTDRAPPLFLVGAA